MKWELKYKNTKKSFEEWGLSKLKRTLSNQTCDKVTFIQNSDSSFKPEESITIYKNDVIWFTGLITKAPSMSKPKLIEQKYEVSGAWWYLQNLVFQQNWQEATNPNEDEPMLSYIRKGRLILGQDINGKHLNNGEQAREIIEYAIKLGVPLRLGEIDVDVVFPMDEIKDLSCAQAITRVLRWSPECVVWFDYSTAPYPTIHIKRRKSTILLDSIKNIHKSIISPRYDLQKKSVVIKYEKTHHSGKATWTTTEVDAYPRGSTGEELKSVVLTVELQGMRGTTVTQKIKTKMIDPSSKEWWQKHLPVLRGIDLEKVKIKNVTRECELEREIEEGNVADWMDVNVQVDHIKADISYETESESVIDKEVVVKLNATDANRNQYKRFVSGIPAEKTPKGLAKKLYESVSQLQYEGFIEIIDNNLDTQLFLGKSIEVEKTKNSIQEIREDVDLGIVCIQFGPAKHLGVCDLVEILRNNRKRTLSSRSYIRKKGEVSTSNVITNSTHSQLQNTTMGSGVYERLEFIDSSNNKRKIIINTKDIPDELVIQLREEYVAENGYLRKRLTLCSNPYGEESLENEE